MCLRHRDRPDDWVVYIGDNSDCDYEVKLEAVGELSGGWQPGPFEAEDGSQRARGIAMASPFGSEAAAIAEVLRF